MLQVALYLTLGNFYFWRKLRMAQLMWKKHHYEFWKHANRLIASLLITPLSTWISGTDSWLWLFDQFCMMNENVMKEAYEDAGL